MKNSLYGRLFQTLLSPSGQMSQHWPLDGSARIGSGQAGAAQRTTRQSTKFSVPKEHSNNPSDITHAKCN